MMRSQHGDNSEPSGARQDRCAPPQRKPARLRRATTVILLATMTLLVGTLYATARSILLRGFAEIEEREIVQNVERAEGALAETLQGLSTKAADWGAWADTCRFIADGNEGYVKSNLTPESLANLGVEAILFFDASGAPAAWKAIDAGGAEAGEPPAGLVEAIRSSPLLRHETPLSAAAGVLMLADGPVLAASRPIVTSANEGPVRGSVVFARRLAPPLLADFAARTLLDISVHVLSATDLPEDCREAMESLKGARVAVLTMSEDRIAGYSVVRDVEGKPALLVRVQTPRDVHEQGLLSLRWLMFSIVLVGAGVGAATLVLLDKLVISRVESMSAMVSRIGAGEEEVAVAEGGVHELGVLSASINRMVGALKAANAELEASREEAEAASRAKTEFLANMSHEIRTPMTAVLGYADLLMEQDVAEKDREHHLEMIRRNGQNLLSIISDILDISNIEAGRLTLRSAPVCPVNIVAEVMGMVRGAAEAKGLRLTAHCDTPVPETIMSDAARLRQVLLNIMGNAVKFTEEGTVSLRLRATRAARGRRGSLVFEVSDTGPGMNPEEIKRLFEPFFQADPSTVRRFGGTGLGVCIAKRLTEALGGTVQIASTAGKGTTFIITIDPGSVEGTAWTSRLTMEPARSEPGANAAATALSGRILVADDMVENRRLVAHILRRAGADVAVVEDGAEAVRAALEARDSGKAFGLIILDMQMPVMDGYTAAARLRAEEVACPIVALTAFALAGEREKCLAAGCDDYATKPIDRAALIKACSNWMNTAVSAGPGTAAR